MLNHDQTGQRRKREKERKSVSFASFADHLGDFPIQIQLRELHKNRQIGQSLGEIATRWPEQE